MKRYGSIADVQMDGFLKSRFDNDGRDIELGFEQFAQITLHTRCCRLFAHKSESMAFALVQDPFIHTHHRSSNCF
jgi:hypothetical protein